MNKKYFMFGLRGLFVMALAAAAIVPYLSNTVEEDISVENPLVLSNGLFLIEGDYDFTEQTTDFTLTNNANIPIHTIVETSITADNNVEFDSVNVGVEFAVLKIGIQIPESHCTAGGGIDWNINSESYCYWDASTDKAYSGVVEGVYYVQMGDGSVPIEADGTMNGRMKFQLNPSIEPANYTFATTAVTVDDAQDL